MSTKSETYVLFEVAGTLYAVRSAEVQHIEMLEQITLVPNANPAVEGVVFSRGQLIPALNLRIRFGFPRAVQTIRTRLIFVQVQRRVVGLIADSAREFRSIVIETVRPIEEALTGIGGNYLNGVATVEGRLVLLLDLEKVLNLELVESTPLELPEVGNLPSPAEKVSLDETSKDYANTKISK